MEIKDIKPKHYDSAIRKLITLSKSLDNYKAQVIPYYPMMEYYERKEYETNYACDLESFHNLKNHIIEHETSFNEILKEYNSNIWSLFHELGIEI